MLQRIAAAVIGLAIIVPSIVWGGAWGAPVVASLALLIALDEYARMAAPDHNRLALALLVVAGGPVYASVFWFPGQATWILALAAVLVLVGCLLRVPDTALGQRTAVRLVTGLLYIVVPFGFVLKVWALPNGLAWLFLTLAVTWAGDTGAYFSGRALGKHKLFPRVSPKKTWEGAVGGWLAAIAFACVFKHLWLPELSWVQAALLGALLDVVGVLGDLVESMFKRSFEVKDSGWIMPGHGGILDRIDSLLFTAPVAWVLATQVFMVG